MKKIPLIIKTHSWGDMPVVMFKDGRNCKGLFRCYILNRHEYEECGLLERFTYQCRICGRKLI